MFTKISFNLLDLLLVIWLFMVGSGSEKKVRIRPDPDPQHLVSGMCVFGENLDRWMIFKNSETFFLIIFLQKHCWAHILIRHTKQIFIFSGVKDLVFAKEAKSSCMSASSITEGWLFLSCSNYSIVALRGAQIVSLITLRAAQLVTLNTLQAAQLVTLITLRGAQLVTLITFRAAQLLIHFAFWAAETLWGAEIIYFRLQLHLCS